VSFTIVLVEPEEKLREEVREVLRQDGYRVWAFARADHAAQAIGESDTKPSLAILSAGDDPGVDRLLETLKQSASDCQRVWIAPSGGDLVDKLAAERRPRGLLSRTDLPQEARRLAERVWRTRERGRALVQVPAMLGRSAAMVRVRDLIDRIAVGGAPTVLITGETGTGKEVTARRLHALGARGHGPFVEVDCASIPHNLLESELFGHEPGAFTDARALKVGLLELAQGGTAFLDEIGELDLGLQAKLLRVLDSRKLRRLGGREEIPLDVHLVAATNRDLTVEVRLGNFRADLFYRLDVVRIELPPLRDREDDGWVLAQDFLKEATRRLGRGALRLAPHLKREFLAYTWPGNVREVRNHMERLALVAPPGTEDVVDLDLPKLSGNASGLTIDFSGGPIPWDDIERQAITGALEAAHGNVSEAARLLGLGRGALRYRMARLGHQEAEEEPPHRKAA
jgi:two-component system, NtrC family, response regulator AtoC